MSQSLALNAVNTVINTPQIIYTAQSGSPKTIKSWTAANTGTVSGSYTAYIASGTPLSPQKPYQVVVWGEIDIGIGLVGQTIPAGASIYVSSSVLTIYFTVTAE